MQKQTAAGVVGVVGGFVLWVLLYKYGPLNFCTVPGEGFGINLHIDVACHPWWKGGFGHLYGGLYTASSGGFRLDLAIAEE